MTDMGGIPDEPRGSSRTCPHCGGTMRPIAYGYPDEELFAAGDRGEVFIGGCVIPEGPVPQWHCTSCDRHVHLTQAPTDA